MPAVAKSATGTMTVSVLPSAEAVPVNTVDPKPFTCVDPLNPVPVNVTCWGEVAPAIKPNAGENDDRVGTSLSIFTAVSVADLSVVTE